MTARCFGWHGLWFGLAVWTGLALCAPAHAASFDCTKAGTAIEKMICGDDALSKLDEDLNAAYKTALQDTQHAEATRQAQKQWLKTRNACQDNACVYQWGLSMGSVSLIVIKINDNDPIGTSAFVIMDFRITS